ncbi:proteasome subunit beta type 3, putative [Eimeria tenella]|uniref:Proteasome subunit beta type 3, putative n=1 Tax=Eimeria tenella TaxID=5802 RepID=U6KXT9_EIMTE|nr:proteasome subunit beta type 3, putative [Eimeria tenella]CDJ42947.1 proteasome subunit beta type 3, putative [Eimeria tenella]|eukprot:XP_013233697.1 proteasome subunit beta type 3, putative [Eimeria tenella]
MDEYNGSAVVAMAGDRCVGIAADRRLGINRFNTISNEFDKCFKVNQQCFVAFPGLATDVQTMHKELRFRCNLLLLREDLPWMTPSLVSSLISSMLYERRFAPFFVSPVVAGLEKDTHKPFLAGFDCIGAACKAEDFIANGTAKEQLAGICEAMWRPKMGEEELLETLSQCLLAGVDRDCVSGWGGVVHVVTPEKIITRLLKGRMD